MDIKEVKELINFAIEKKVRHLSYEDVSFTLSEEAFAKDEPSLTDDTPLEEVAATFKKKVEDERSQYLKELFNHE